MLGIVVIIATSSIGVNVNFSSASNIHDTNSIIKRNEYIIKTNDSIPLIMLRETIP